MGLVLADAGLCPHLGHREYQESQINEKSVALDHVPPADAPLPIAGGATACGGAGGAAPFPPLLSSVFLKSEHSHHGSGLWWRLWLFAPTFLLWLTTRDKQGQLGRSPVEMGQI